MNIRKGLYLILMLSLLFVFNGVLLAQDNIPAANKSCLTCHQREGFSTKHDGKEISLTVDPAVLADSVHKNNPCTTCHMNIQGFPHQDVVYGQELTVQVTKSCQMCHANVAKDYKASKHWKATKNGMADVSCNACHGEHNVQKLELTKQEEVKMCTQCHQGAILEGYKQSFHGKAVLLGSQESASCVDCHGAHKALGDEVAASPVSAKNKPATCAKCHQDAQANFAKGSEHLTLSAKDKNKIPYYISKAYIWLIILTIGFMLVHILIELFGKFRKAKKDDITIDVDDSDIDLN
ncbi:cytochrome c3 family protein [Candidatus Frackibacter sp. WG13]|uniref:cytochrome c3 family protein n=1 Tax=Candidatus Frackibacter sp. WG13 TaxID=2017978 RepID=UPI000B7F66A3|nr:cytochrome c3 family protein [Candidatus Frackibacter sp. WG13]